MQAGIGKKILALFVLLAVLFGLFAYLYFLPFMASRILPALLSNLGCDLAKISLPKIEASHAVVEEFSCRLKLQSSELQIAAKNVEVLYSLKDVWRGEFRSLKVESVALDELAPTQAAGNALGIPMESATLPVATKTKEEKTSPSVQTGENPFQKIDALLEIPLPNLPLRQVDIENVTIRGFGLKLFQPVHVQKLRFVEADQRWKLDFDAGAAYLRWDAFTGIDPYPAYRIESSDSASFSLSLTREQGRLASFEFFLIPRTNFLLFTKANESLVFTPKEIRLLYDKQDLKLNTTLDLDQKKFSHLELTYKKGRPRVDWMARLEPLSFSPLDLTLRTLLKWPTLPVQIHSGSLQISANGAVAPNQKGALIASAAGEINAVDVGGFYEEFVWQGVNTKVRWSSPSLPQTIRLETNSLKIQKIQLAAVSVTDIDTYLQFEKRGKDIKARIKNFGAKSLGGSLSLDAFDYSNEVKKIGPVATLKLNSIDLAEILKLKQHEEISATGKISAVLPIRLDRIGFAVLDGEARNMEPGVIRYLPGAETGALASGNPALAIATSALSDFRYTELVSKVNFSPVGKLNLSLRVEGSNPSFQRGKPVHFNIDLEEDLLALLQSLTIAEDFSRTLDERVQLGSGATKKAPAKKSQKKN